MKPEYRAMVITDETPEGILDQFANYEAPAAKTYHRGQRVM